MKSGGRNRQGKNGVKKAITGFQSKKACVRVLDELDWRDGDDEFFDCHLLFMGGCVLLALADSSEQS
jgi:hypothetical protein